MNEIEIKKVFEKFSGLNLDEQNRNKHVIALKSVYCKVCRDFGKNELGNKLTYNQIGDAIKVNHATVIYHCKQTYKNALKQSDVAFNLYTAFKNGEFTKKGKKLKSIDYSSYENRIKELENEIVMMQSVNIPNNEITRLISQVPDEKIGMLIERLKPMIKMLCKAKFYPTYAN